jgi:hypothetical protein
MRRRWLTLLRLSLHFGPLALAVLVTLACAAGALFPIKFGPFPDRIVPSTHICVRCEGNREFRVCFMTHPFTPHPPTRSAGNRDAGEDTEWKKFVSWHGFTYMQTDAIANSTNLITCRYWDFQIPYWMPAMGSGLCTVLLTLLHVRRWRRKFPADAAARPCLRCRYDLRAHHAGEKCPECGLPLEGKMQR